MKTSTLTLGVVALTLAGLFAAQWDNQWAEDSTSEVVGAAERKSDRPLSSKPEQNAPAVLAPDDDRTPPQWMQETPAVQAKIPTQREFVPLQTDIFRTPPKPVPPPPIVIPAPPAPVPQPRFTVIGRVIDGTVKQVIVQDGARVVTLGVGQNLQGFTLNAIEENVAVFSFKQAESATRHRLEYGKAPTARPVQPVPRAVAEGTGAVEAETNVITVN